MESLRLILTLMLVALCYSSCATKEGMEIGDGLETSGGIDFEGLPLENVPRDCSGKWRNTKGCEEDKK